MLNWIVSTSLRARVLVLALAAVTILWGVQSVRKSPMDVFPEFAPPFVEIQTEAPGLSTEEVESLITVPLENALNATAGRDVIRSKSVLGLSSVVLFFKPGADLMEARQRVQELLAVAQARLPEAAETPVILPPLSTTSRALKIGLSSETLDQMELTDLALWTIRPRLMAVSGVANVAIWGQREKQYQVLADPQRLQANDLTLNDVRTKAAEASRLGAGGFIDTPNQRMAVQHVSFIDRIDDLAETVAAFRDGNPVRLGDVTEVTHGFPPPIGNAIINDGPGLLLIVEKQPSANTLELTKNVEAAMEDLSPALPGVEVDTTIFRPATFIEMSIQNLARAMWLSCILVIVVLIVFLNDWRTAFISITAIPLSLLTALLVLSWLGETVNTMVLAGLVIAVGEVVDDAIIDVENIMRRLRLNADSSRPKSAFQVVLSASLEVRSAVVFASLIVVLVFLPVFFLDGLAGSFFRPLAFSYLLAILASLAVALTLTPALSLVLLPGGIRRRGDAPLIAGLKQRYRRSLPWILSRPRIAAGILLFSFAAAGLGVLGLGEEFLPNFKERDFLMHWVEKSGTSIEAMDRITIEVSKELRSIPGVRNFGAHIGRAEIADEVVGPNFTELWISLDPEVDYDSTVARIQEVVDGYPGLYRDLLTYLRERIKEVLTGTSATIVVRIYGPELDVLREKADAVAEVISSVHGVVDLKVEPQDLVPQIRIKIKPEAASLFGLTPWDVRGAATTLIRGDKVGEVYKGQAIYDVVVWGVPRVRSDVQALRELRIDTPAGTAVPLGDVADIQIEPTPNRITRERSSRKIDVTCNVRGRDLGGVAKEIQAVVDKVSFERGYHPELLGEYQARAASQKRLMALAAFSIIGILVLLHVDFGSTRLMLLVALSLPFALVGGVFSAWIGGGVLSLGSLVGFITVLGIAARNGIMLVSHYRYLEREEGATFGHAMILRGSEERLAPILMTVLTAALALLPLVLGGNEPGHEIEHPMAVVILGGLITSTVLNLFLLPSFYCAACGPNRPSGSQSDLADDGPRIERAGPQDP